MPSTAAAAAAAAPVAVVLGSSRGRRGRLVVGLVWGLVLRVTLVVVDDMVDGRTDLFL